jgi:aminoglycoside phosphotransferase (APT) family kinase protein
VDDRPAANTTPWRSDPGTLHEHLTAWARHFRGRDVVVTDVRAPDSGMANDSLFFTIDREELLVRLAPTPDAVFPTFRTYDLERQRRVMDLVRARTDVPVPDVIHVEASTQWFGVPFLVTRVVEGVVPSDNPPYLLDPTGWFLQGTPERWKRFEHSTIDVLVRLHRIAEGDETAFLHLDAPGATALERQVSDLRSYYEWARNEHSVPILERGIDVVGKTMPANARSVLNWGDSRPGNIIYRDFAPVAVLDWEMATVGPPEVDVAWTTFFQKFFGSMADQYGLSVPPMFDTAGTVATYEQLGGQHLADLAWYEGLAACRFAIILLRMAQRSAAYGLGPLAEDPDDLIMFAPLFEQILERI